MSRQVAVAAGPTPFAADSRTAIGLRAVAIAGLGVEAYVHLRLAPLYDQIGASVTQGMLFRLQAAAAVVAAVLLLLSDRRHVWVLGGLVALAGSIAVLLTRFVQLPALGPVPAMYDPQWTPDKVFVTVAMTATVLAWLAREALRRKRALGGGAGFDPDGDRD